jgi:AcrR family transcriptional regulator
MASDINNAGAPVRPLPPALSAAFRAAAGGGAKRERTQAQLVAAAVQVFSARGLAAATMQEVAQVAGVTAGTVYNHFSSKGELLERLAHVLADGLCRAINDSYSHITDGAERMAIGQRRYVWLAAEHGEWALLLLDVVAQSPAALEKVQQYPLQDLRLGVRQRKFKVPSEAAALDAINGICMQAMRRVTLGLAPPRHDIAAASLVLRALGMAPAEALEVAKRPLPELGGAPIGPGA